MANQKAAKAARAKKKKPANKPAANGSGSGSATASGGRSVSIRMYRQGLGDCFLLTFPRAGKPFHLLLDCGALNSKFYGAEDMKRVVTDIGNVTGKRLDVIAATHEHWDHTSGFDQAKAIFDEIDVKDVWVAWTEEPENKAAAELKRLFKKKKKAVAKAIARIPEKNSPLAPYRKAVSDLFGFYGGLGAADGGGKGAAAAWQYILKKGRNVYCDPHKDPFELEDVPGVRVYILGPPQDPDYVRKLLSKKETYDAGFQPMSMAEAFLAAVDPAGDPVAQARAMPFDAEFRIPKATAKNHDFFRQRYGFTDGDSLEWRRIDNDWLSVVGELALHLDSYTNNTCLAFAVELVESGKVLLFPGDAQVGNWLSWATLSWEVKDAAGIKSKVKADDLLKRTVFYKVGHHGSHNATMRGHGLEMMGSDQLLAMIPVHRLTAKDQDWKFPYPPLWERLKEKTGGRVVLADDVGLKEVQTEVQARQSKAAWQKLTESLREDKLYIEYRIPF